MNDKEVKPANLRVLEEIVSRHGIVALRSLVDACREIQGNDGVVDVGVFGRFKAGKSTFLNSIIGEGLLPVGVTPATAVITRIRYGESERIRVLYSNGREEHVSKSEIGRFVTEELNPENGLGVKSVEIETPAMKRFPGVQFVDTPGLGSVFKHNTETTLDWLPRAGLSLVAIGVDPPLSDADLALIRELLPFTPKIAILLTKVDLLSSEETAAVRAFVARELSKYFGKQFPTFLYSSRKDQAAFANTIESELLQPILSQGSEQARAIFDHKVEGLTARIREYLNVALAASKKVDWDLSALKRHILDERVSASTIENELRLIVRDATSHTRPGIMVEFQRERPDIQARLETNLHRNMKEWQVNLWKFTRAYEDWSRQEMATELQQLSSHSAPKLVESVEMARKRLQRSVEAFQERLSKNVRDSLRVALSPPEFAISVPAPKSPDISIGGAFDFKLDLIWFLVPMKVFRGPVERHFLRLLPYEVEKNLSRLASQWTDRINAAVMEMGKQAERHAQLQIASIEEILRRSRSNTHEVERDLVLLDSPIGGDK